MPNFYKGLFDSSSPCRIDVKFVLATGLNDTLAWFTIMGLWKSIFYDSDERKKSLKTVKFKFLRDPHFTLKSQYQHL